MPTGLTRQNDGRTQEQIDLTRAVREERTRRGLTLSDVERESGYYGHEMLRLLERGLSPGEKKVRMSRRGMQSLLDWLAKSRRKNATLPEGGRRDVG